LKKTGVVAFAEHTDAIGAGFRFFLFPFESPMQQIEPIDS
jgi:hypothetical protein